MKGALPVGERLTDRHIPVDARCKRCGESESIIHLFAQCPFSTKIWSLTPVDRDLDFSGMIDLVEIWNSISSVQCLPPSGITSKSLAPWILWSIWKARNKLVFENFSGSSEDILSSALSMAREWEISQGKEPQLRDSRQPSLRQVSPGTTVIRTDAAWSPTRTATGLGWVIISASGHREFHKQVACAASPLLAEGLAMLEAIQTGAREGLTSVVFESDSTQLVKAVNAKACNPELYGVVSDILSFSAIFVSFGCVWIPRERNVQADSLAKFALNVVENSVGDGAFMSPN